MEFSDSSERNQADVRELNSGEGFWLDLRRAIRRTLSRHFELSDEDVRGIEAEIVSQIWERLTNDPADQVVARIMNSPAYRRKWLNFRALDWFREQSSRSESLQHPKFLETPDPDALRDVERIEQQIVFRDVVLRLKPRTRTWFRQILYAYVHELTDLQMAMLLKISPSAYSYRKDHVLTEIEKLLE